MDSLKTAQINHMPEHRTCRSVLAVALLLLVTLLPAAAMAEGKIVTVTSRSRNGEMDSTPVLVIQETRRQMLPDSSATGQAARRPEHGIVGLDMQVTKTRYPIIQGVFPHTPADRAGMLPGDTLIAVNGTQAIGQSASALDAMISDKPGDRITFLIERQGALHQFTLTVAPADDISNALRY